MCNIYISYEKRSHLATYFTYQGFPNSSVGKRICLQCRRPQFDSWVRKIHWSRDRLPTPVFLGFPLAQLVKNPPAMQETWVRSLGEDPLEKAKATHSSILAWRIPWTVKSHGVAKSQTRLSDFHFSLSYTKVYLHIFTNCIISLGRVCSFAFIPQTFIRHLPCT